MFTVLPSKVAFYDLFHLIKPKVQSMECGMEILNENRRADKNYICIRLNAVNINETHAMLYLYSLC